MAVTAFYHDEMDYKKSIVFALEGLRFDVQEHEDKFSRYIPDLSFASGNVDGWAEVKYCRNLPATLRNIDHFTAGQVVWLENRYKKGSGLCGLILGVRGHGHWFFPGNDIRAFMDTNMNLLESYFVGHSMLQLVEHLSYRVSCLRSGSRTG